MKVSWTALAELMMNSDVGHKNELTETLRKRRQDCNLVTNIRKVHCEAFHH